MSKQIAKSNNALKTIGEAAEVLDLPQHVLRFWETKFHQIAPLKRRGGRRFYRPEDIKILETIKHLLHEKNYTIKGALSVLDENGSIKPTPQLIKQESTPLTSTPVKPTGLNKNHKSQLSTLRNELTEMRDSLKKAI